MKLYQWFLASTTDVRACFSTLLGPSTQDFFWVGQFDVTIISHCGPFHHISCLSSSVEDIPLEDEPARSNLLVHASNGKDRGCLRSHGLGYQLTL